MTNAYYSWLAQQPGMFKEDDYPQPSNNEAVTFTYIPRKDGDPVPESWNMPPGSHGNPTGAVSYSPYTYSYPVSFSLHSQYQGTHSRAPQYPTYTQYQPYTYQYPPAPSYYYPHAPPPQQQLTYYPPTYTYPSYYAGPAAAKSTLLPDGTYAFYGRTRQEVEQDNHLIAAKQAAGGAHKIVPDAPADTMFWVWEPDHMTRNMYRLDTIKRNFKGKWEWDPATNLPFFTRNREP